MIAVSACAAPGSSGVRESCDHLDSVVYEASLKGIDLFELQEQTLGQEHLCEVVLTKAQTQLDANAPTVVASNDSSTTQAKPKLVTQSAPTELPATPDLSSDAAAVSAGTETPSGDSSASPVPATSTPYVSYASDPPKSEEPLTPADTAVIAVPSVGNITGNNLYGSPDFIRQWGIGETLFRQSGDNSASQAIASDWILNPDLSGATILIRDDVPFQNKHGEFGNVTAADVAWSMNTANASVSPESEHPHTGNFAAAWGEWQVIGTHEISFETVQFDSTWQNDILNHSGNSFTVFSKEAFDRNGEDWVRDNIVATGPYEVESWHEKEQLTLVSRYVDGGQHYLPERTPKTNRVQFIHVPEPATRPAMLRLGVVDAALLEPLDGVTAADGGFESTGTDYVVQLGIFFTGNLWEETYAITGEPLPTKGPFVHDLAWIGNPTGKHDGGTPNDDMEQARLVRKALTLAIDREKINEDLLGGLGTPVHVAYFSTSDPNWDQKWEYPTDIQEARGILASDIGADYSHLKLGPGIEDYAFEIQIKIGPELGGSGTVTEEIADAIASDWNQLGLSASAVRGDRYIRNHFKNTQPHLTSCELGQESLPWHHPKGLLQTTLVRSGYGCGTESPDILEFYRRMATAENQQAATLAATDYLEYVHYWHLQPGVIAVPFNVYYNPEKISSWPMPKSVFSPIDGVWNLELK